MSSRVKSGLAKGDPSEWVRAAARSMGPLEGGYVCEIHATASQ